MARLLVATVLAALLGQASGTQAASALTSRRSMISKEVFSRSFVKSLSFRHSVRICNAYPSDATMKVIKAQNVREADDLTEGGPLAYKECRDVMAELKEDDRLDFRVGTTSAGSFKVNELPNHDAVLLLVVHRHDTLSSAVSFESHVFASLQNAQVAVLDTYKGMAVGMPRIRDAKGESATMRSEELRYDSVVAVNPGLYEVVLMNDKSESIAKAALVAVNHESYVVLRVGVEAQQGQSYPQDIVVYPRSKVKDAQGSAARMGLSGLTMAAALALTTLLA
jgi:phosphoribosylformylglycinamidine (FGAM) synthase PurS component